MTNMARRTLTITLALTLAISAAAFAAALRGKTYEGGVPSSGVSSRRHRVKTLHAGGNISLRVSSNGTSVTVRFSSPYPVLYCETGKALVSQSTKPARISGSGTFTAAIAQRFSYGPGPPSIVQVVSGRFSGRNVSGTIRTEAADCSGSASMYARAR
jgi:hypothetical protein